MTRSYAMSAVGLLLLATMSWGGMFPVAKYALTLMDPYYMTLIRYAPAAIVFLSILYWFEGRGALRLEGRGISLLLLGTLGFAGFNLLAFNGLVYSRPEHGAVIMALMPMITVIMTWLLKGQRPHRFTMIAVASAFLGVFLVISGGHPTDTFAGGTAEWDLLFLSGAFCWVSYTMGAQRFPDWSPLRYTAITCALGALSITLVTFALTLNGTIDAPPVHMLLSEQWVIAYLVIMGALVAVLSWNAGIKMLGSVNGVLFINFVPITAFTIGVIQGRSFSIAEVSGAFLVIGALLANNIYLRRQLPKEAY
jgi:drug/metabolite transporter (DMT)-like permease